MSLILALKTKFQKALHKSQKVNKKMKFIKIAWNDPDRARPIKIDTFGNMGNLGFIKLVYFLSQNTQKI